MQNVRELQGVLQVWCAVLCVPLHGEARPSLDSEMSNLLDGIQSASRSFFKRLDETVDHLTVPDFKREPDKSMETNGRVLKLSSVIVALHIASAKWTCKVWPKYLEAKIKEYVIKGSARAVAKAATFRALKAVPGIGTFEALLSESLIFIQGSASASEMETLIRESFEVVRKEMNNELLLPQKAKRAKVKDVLTRNGKAKLKRRQKGWKSR